MDRPQTTANQKWVDQWSPLQTNFGRDVVFSADLCYIGISEKPLLLGSKAEAKRHDPYEFDEVNRMIDITAWMDEFLQKINRKFETRVWFVGLQGSYGRGEARDTSDIDIVVILDRLSASDIREYRKLQELP